MSRCRLTCAGSPKSTAHWVSRFLRKAATTSACVCAVAPAALSSVLRAPKVTALDPLGSNDVGGGLERPRRLSSSAPRRARAFACVPGRYTCYGGPVASPLSPKRHRGGATGGRAEHERSGEAGATPQDRVGIKLFSRMWGNFAVSQLAWDIVQCASRTRANARVRACVHTCAHMCI